jgi:hypothetical protein
MEAIKENGTALFVTTVLKNWSLQATRVNELIEGLSDEDLAKEVAPGRNTGIYLLGHLVAVHDGIRPLLGLGEKRYPEFEAMFIRSADTPNAEYPSLAVLRKYWTEVNTDLWNHFSTISPEDWLSRHTAVTPEVFANEPHRNKINIVLNRTGHLAYHHGQLVFLKKK